MARAGIRAEYREVVVAIVLAANTVWLIQGE
jgi:hypothetical protein